MLLDTIADPGPLEAGKVYRLDLPALRHTRLHDSFVPGIATLPCLPSTELPTGFAPDGLLLGVQIVGPWLEDPTPLKLAELIEREFGGFVPPKMFDN